MLLLEVAGTGSGARGGMTVAKWGPLLPKCVAAESEKETHRKRKKRQRVHKVDDNEKYL